ncbi:hypothetical protein M1446_03420 [Candidatus Dependentiae bacterium]|nr:hypothetical protein [Candidatus Dependentiae bacterium]
MKKLLAFLILCFSINLFSKELELVDETLMTIYHPEGNVLIIKSDIKSGLTGAPRTPRDLLVEELAILDSKKLKIEVSDQDVEKYLNQLQKQAGYTKKQIEMSFKELGYTIESGKEELRRAQMIQEITTYRTRSQKQLIVTPEAIYNYYIAHPIKQEAVYKIAQGIFNFNPKKSKEENLKALDKLIKSGDINYAILWDEPIELKESEFSKNQKFITTMEESAVAKLKTTENSIVLVKLVKKFPEAFVPLEEREEEIEMQLKMKKVKELVNEYQEKLIKDAKINYHTHIDFLDQQPLQEENPF